MELKIPALKKTGKGIFKTQPESLRQWVDNLPLVNIETTVGRLEYGLSEINSVDLPPRDRMEVLELLTTPVMYITGALQKKYLGKKFPLNSDQHNKSNQAIGLCLAMATGYKILVATLNRTENATPWLATMMHRAIRYLSESLLDSFQIYSQHREGIWADLHSLYALSEKQGLQTYPVTDTTLQNPTTTTIENTYKQILLLSLAGPYHLRQREIRLIYNLLGRWASSSKLHMATEHDIIGFFTCHLDSDDPPSYLLLSQKDRLDEQWRILDTSGMTEPVQTFPAEHHDSSSHQNGLPDENTLRRLMLAWGVMPKRRSARKHQEAPIQLVLGINAIHHLISGPDMPDSGDRIREMHTTHERNYQQDPTFEQPTVINTSYPVRNDSERSASIKNKGSKQRGNNPFRGAFAVDPRVVSAGGEQTLSIESWKMVDISADGYCLLWESEDVSSAQVGELVAIRTVVDSSDDSWKLGVIRWMRFTPERGLGLGVQLISDVAKPVWACRCNDKPTAENKTQGILLPEDKALNQQASLLLPSLPFRTGCLSTLTSGGNEEKIRLVRQIENTGSFAQFHFTPAAEP